MFFPEERIIIGYGKEQIDETEKYDNYRYD